MTNKEAIEILKSKMDGSVDSSYEWGEAIRLAIYALNRMESSEKKNEFLVDKFEELDSLKTRVKILESQMSELLQQTSDENEKLQGKWRDFDPLIDIPKICEECQDRSYDNGYRAGYRSCKENAQKRIAELNERIEIMKYKLQVYKHNSNLGDEVETKEGNDEKKDIVDIPKMCEECHSQSYVNGFDAGYELGKNDRRLLTIGEQKGDEVKSTMAWVKVVENMPMYDKEGIKTWGAIYQCPNCGFCHNVIEDRTLYKFCPDCGEDMR